MSRVDRQCGPVWYAKYRLPDGRQVQKKIGPAWTRRGRPADGYFTKRTAEAWLRDALEQAREGDVPVPRGERATFADAAREWLRYTAQERISSDEQFWAIAATRLTHLFPRLPQRPGFVKRRLRLADTIEALIVEFARHSPGFEDDLLVVDSTPVECGRSVETMRRSALGVAADYGYCASHSRYFRGFRLHGLFATDGTPRALALTSPKVGERDVCLNMLARLERRGPVTVIGDKGYAGREFEAKAAELGARIVRPRRKDEPGRGPHLAPIRQCVESIFWTAKDMLGLETHGARELHTLRARLAAKFLALTAAIALNHRLGRPPRNLTAYYA